VDEPEVQEVQELHINNISSTSRNDATDSTIATTIDPTRGRSQQECLQWIDRNKLVVMTTWPKIMQDSMMEQVSTFHGINISVFPVDST
jgi:hypothetical protein